MPVRFSFLFFFFSFADHHPFVTRRPIATRRPRPHRVVFALSRRPRHVSSASVASPCRVALATSPPSRRPVASPRIIPSPRVTLRRVALAMSPPSRRPIATRRPPPRHVAQAARLTGLGSATEMEGCEWVGWKCEIRVDYLVVNLVDCLCCRLSIQSNPFLISYQSDF
jgi:hypothetical protein